MVDSKTIEQNSSIIENVNVRVRRSIKTLLVRQIFLTVLNLVGGIILARTLGPIPLGLFIISSFIISTFAMLGDFGLGPSFIQRSAELTDRDLQVGFTLQQVLTTAVVLVVLLSAPLLTLLYPKAPLETVWLVRVLAFNLYMTSWRAMSALKLERQLQYNLLAWIEVVEGVSYQVIAVGLVLTGFGIWSLVWAVLVRSLLGAVLVYWAAPWRVRLRFDANITKEVLRFGIPFQMQNLAIQAAEWITPVFVGAFIGPRAVGLLTWADLNGNRPIVFLYNVMRVAFPHFSRIQDDRAKVERALIKYLTCLLLPAGLWSAILLINGPTLVEWIFSSKWLPAVPALMIYSIALSFDIIGWTVGVALNGIGLVGFATRCYLARSLANIVLSIGLVYCFGFSGVAVAQLIVVALNIPLLFRGLGQTAMRRVLLPVTWVLLPILMSMMVGSLVNFTSLSTELHILVTTISMFLVYVAVTWLTCPRWLKDTVIQTLRKYMPAKLASTLRVAKWHGSEI